MTIFVVISKFGPEAAFTMRADANAHANHLMSLNAYAGVEVYVQTIWLTNNAGE